MRVKDLTNQSLLPPILSYPSAFLSIPPHSILSLPLPSYLSPFLHISYPFFLSVTLPSCLSPHPLSVTLPYYSHFFLSLTLPFYSPFLPIPLPFSPSPLFTPSPSHLFSPQIAFPHSPRQPLPLPIAVSFPFQNPHRLHKQIELFLAATFIIINYE